MWGERAAPRSLPAATNTYTQSSSLGRFRDLSTLRLETPETGKESAMKRSNVVMRSDWLGEGHWGRSETVMGNAMSSWRVVALAATFALGLSLAGCATESLQGREDLTQRIAEADTRSEHEDLAAWYEQEAKAAEEQVGYHQHMQQLYEARRDRPARGKLQMAPYVAYDQGTNTEWTATIEACKSRVRGAEQAVEDYLTLARVHRQMAAAAKE
jgi:hypothetical protein